jgi:hypothetical protein
VAAACGSAPAYPPAVATPEGAWTINITQTGGFAGVQLVARVSSDGRLEAEDGRSGRLVEQQLPRSTVQEIGQLLAQIDLPPAQRPGSSCADCFIYDLELSSATGMVRLQVDDTSIADSGAQPVIQLLVKLRDQALQSAN